MRLSIWVIIVCMSLSGIVQGQQAPNNAFRKADSLFMASVWKEALDEYTLVVKSVPNAMPVVFYRMGVSSQMLGNYEEAMKFYETALSKNPVPQVLNNIYVNKALIFASRGQKEDAYKQLELAINNNYINPGAQLQAFKDFASLKDEDRFKKLLNAASLNAMPCKKDPRYKEFDFWVGEWDVYRTGTNIQAGKSVIEKANGDCILVENWYPLANPGAGGKSFNYINPATGKWEQFYLASLPNPPQRYLNGELKDNAMVFLTEITPPNGQKSQTRFSFFNQGNDQVRQLYEISPDGGSTWNVQYDFTYKRKK